MSGFCALINKFILILLVVCFNVRAEIHNGSINKERALVPKDQATQRLLIYIANACGLNRNVLVQDKNNNTNYIDTAFPQDHSQEKGLKENDPNIPNKTSVINPGVEPPEKKSEAKNNSNPSYQEGNNADNTGGKKALHFPRSDSKKSRTKNANKSSSVGNNGKSQSQAPPPKDNRFQDNTLRPPPRDPMKAVLHDSKGERVTIEMRNGKPYCPGHENETLTAENGKEVKVGSDGSLPPPPRPKKPPIGNLF